jgi:hypothetical protein
LFSTTISGTGSSTTFSLNGYYSNLRARLILWGDANGYNFTASAASGVDSKSISGFAAEGMVFGPDNTTLYIGLRAPLVPTANRTKAVIAPIINFESWYNNGSPSGNPTFGAPIELNLGGRGFRDIIRLANGTYIIVAGNAAGSPITSAIYKWTGNTGDTPVLVPTSADAILNLEGAMEVNASGLLSMSQLQVVSDGGTDVLYADGIAAKDFTDLNLRKFRLDNINSIDLCFAVLTSINASNNVICSGETTTLTAIGASTYSWSGGITGSNNIVSPTTNTTYNLIGNDLYGCTSSSAITITVNPKPTISISSTNTLICLGQSVVLLANTAATSYSWSNGASTMSITVSPTTTTVYSVTVNDGLCSANSSITQSVSACTVINELNNNSSIRIYPNPFNESVTISWDSSINISNETPIYIYNTLGDVIFQIKTNDNKIDINLKDLSSGAYLIKVNNITHKIIKL